jgi:hypothetical protein
LRWSGTKGHAQLGGVLRKLRFDGEGGTSNQSTAGWGVNTSFNVKPFAKDELMGQFAYGEGIAHYIEALSGQGSDAAFASDGSLEAIPETAVVLGFTRHWSSTLRSGISYAFLNVDNVAAQPASAIKQTRDFRVNLFYTPYRLVDVAWEVLWGRRENRNGSSGDAVRGQVAFIYRFN